MLWQWLIVNILIDIDKNVGTFIQGSEIAGLYDGKSDPGKVGTDMDQGYLTNSQKFFNSS